MSEEITKESLMEGIFGQKISSVGEISINSNSSNIIDVPLEDIRDFGGENRKHRFKLNETKVDEIADSIDVIGKILTPCIIRKDPENITKYECLAGHHRRAAAEKKGLKCVPAIVIKCDSDIEAQAITAITNTQREELTIMEKAYLLRYQYDYLKHQGKSSNGKWAIKELEKENNESASTLLRYIKLTNLIEELQNCVENKSIPKNAAIVLADLSKENQKFIYDIINSNGVTVSVSQAMILKEKAKELTLNEIRNIIICDEDKKIKKFNVYIPGYAKDYFPDECNTAKKRNDLILKLLIAYKENPDMIEDPEGDIDE